MSFAADVKEELYEHIEKARHCRVAELGAILEFGGEENPALYRKGFTLLEKTYKIKISSFEEISSLKQINEAFDVDSKGIRLNREALKHICCRRSYLRGAFLAAGSMSDPNKSYHLEIVCRNPKQAEEIQGILASFRVEGRIAKRKGSTLLYIKDAESIADFLNICGAHRALMEMESLRVIKDVRNNINRRVNCETANIHKTVSAAARQVAEIEYIRDHYGFEKLPYSLRIMAETRLENPEATLAELGEYMDPPVGKSGVNHRLRKLSDLACSLQ